MDKAMENKAVFSNTQAEVAEVHMRLDDAKNSYLEALMHDHKPEYIENYERVTKAAAETENVPEVTQH
jgi:hypothetical protein